MMKDINGNRNVDDCKFDEISDWENILQSQINELSCLAEEMGIVRPGKIGSRRTKSKLIYPIITFDAIHCPYPTVIGLVFTGLAGKTLFFGMGKMELPLELRTYLDSILCFEGMLTNVHWDAATVIDLFLESRTTIILLPEDILFAREYGLMKLMQQVKRGERSTNRLVVNKMGRMALGMEHQKSAFIQLKEKAADE